MASMLRKQTICVLFSSVMAFSPSPSLLWKAPALQRVNLALRNKPMFSTSMQMDKINEKKLFVSGIPFALSSEDLRETFEKFGPVEDSYVVKDRETGRSRGFGFITFSSKEAASQACSALNDADLGGRTVKVSFAKDRDDQPRARQDRPRRNFKPRGSNSSDE